MKRLINTKLFCMLEKMNRTFNPGEQDMSLVYDDFVHKVTSLCACPKGDVPAYFTLHYTRLELEGVQILLSDEGAGGKCPNSELYRSLPVVSVCRPAMGRG